MKLGLCGTSNISKTYLKSLNYLGHQIEIVYGNDLGRLKNFSKQHKIPIYSDNIADLISNNEIKSYIIANDPSKHLDIAEILVKADKNVLIEKPLDISINKIENFCQFIKNKKNIIHVVNQNRFDPYYINLRDNIVEKLNQFKENTKFVNLNMFFFRDQNYFNSSNGWKKNYSCPLTNQGVHFLDLLIWIFGDFLEVKSFSQKYNNQLKLNDNVAGSIKFENNVLVNIFSSTSIKRSEVKFEFYCGDQVIEFRKKNSFSRLKKIFFNSRNQFDLFVRQCSYFINCIDNKKFENNNVADAYKAVSLAKQLNN